jgi:hypothetical protein
MEVLWLLLHLIVITLPELIHLIVILPEAAKENVTFPDLNLESSICRFLRAMDLQCF